MRGGRDDLEIESLKIRDLNGNGNSRLLPVDVLRMQVPLVPPPVPGIDDLEDVLRRTIQQ
jgi:hypothetical protein